MALTLEKSLPLPSLFPTPGPLAPEPQGLGAQWDISKQHVIGDHGDRSDSTASARNTPGGKSSVDGCINLIAKRKLHKT